MIEATVKIQRGPEAARSLADTGSTGRERWRPSMNQLSKGSRTRIGPQQRPTGLDLILQARALRHQWLASALARLSAKLARLGSGLAGRAHPGRMPQPAVPEPRRLADRAAT